MVCSACTGDAVRQQASHLQATKGNQVELPLVGYISPLTLTGGCGGQLFAGLHHRAARWLYKDALSIVTLHMRLASYRFRCVIYNVHLAGP